MKKFVALVLTTALFAGAAIGTVAAAANDVYTYKVRNGNVTFNHAQHAQTMDCARCHAGTPAAIEVNRDFAHGIGCKGCHEEMKAGPTRCNDCHKK